MPPFDAVIFDCDGVLVDSESLALEVELEILAGCGLSYGRSEFIARFMGRSDLDFRDALDADSRERLGRSLPDDFLEVTHAARIAICRERLVEVAGALEAVSALTLAKAVASSSRSAFLREKLQLAGLVEAFEPHIYSTQLVARSKPHPDVFLHAAEQLGVAPSRCLVIEDSVHGVTAGLAAGMTVWGFTGGGHCDEAAGEALAAAGAHRVVESWPAFAAALAEAAR
jgi:HAD superfamily hydrolase (TIGR01509 family)